MPTTHVVEEAAPIPHDSPLPRVYSLGSDEGSLTLNELTVLCTSLSKNVESLESDLKQTKQTYDAAYSKFIMKVKKLEHKVKSINARRKTGGRSDEDLMYETGVNNYLEGFTRPSISITIVEPVTTVSEEVSTARVIPKEVSTAEPDMDVTLAEALVDLLNSGKKKSTNPKARGISFQDPEEVEIREKPLKKKDQIQSDEELALKLHAEEQAEFERLQKERAAQEDASRAAIYEEMDNIQAMIEADEQLATRVQDKEQELYSIEEKSRLLLEMIAERKRFFTTQRAAEQRRHDVAVSVESLATKYPIVDWKTHMLDDFDRQDVLDLYRIVKERFESASPEGYDRLLWGDLITVFKPSKDDEVWKAQQDYKLISWRLFDSCGIHVLLMDTGISIHMLVEKTYPLTQEMLSRMLSRKLEVDNESEMAFELLRFTGS
ncbi:hypothetical protein Tco_0561162 [Tanacetum coccineum]